MAGLLVLPVIVVLLLGWARHDSESVGSSQFSFGPVAAHGVLLPMPPMAQMMMPMAEGGTHGDELQVTVQVRNDTDRAVTVPFGRVHLLAADGSAVAASDGLQGDLALRPHAVAEERLRFPAATPGARQVRLSIPDGRTTHVLMVPVGR